jgi:hypothetical protein
MDKEKVVAYTAWIDLPNGTSMWEFDKALGIFLKQWGCHHYDSLEFAGKSEVDANFKRWNKLAISLKRGHWENEKRSDKVDDIPF